MTNPNELAQWLKFYDEQHLSRPRSQPFGYGVFGGGGAVTEDGPDRLAWAQAMAGNNGAPDFFASANQLAPYTQPQPFTEQMPQRKPTNYLASLMRGR